MRKRWERFRPRIEARLCIFYEFNNEIKNAIGVLFL
jgi:hypothetical protein